MSRLSKRNYDVTNTIETYFDLMACGCSCSCDCSCDCSKSNPKASFRNRGMSSTKSRGLGTARSRVSS